MRGDGKIFLRGGTFHLTYYGRRANGTWGKIRESAHTADRAEAARKLRQRVRQAKNGRDGIAAFVGPDQRKITMGNLFDDLARDWRQREIKSLTASLGHLEQVRKVLGSQKALAVTRRLLEDYIERERARDLAAATINRRLEVVSKAFRLGKERGCVGFSPAVPRLREDNARTGYVEAWQFEEIARLLDQPFQDVARFAYMTAWRRSEVIGLPWAAVDRDGREITLRTSKSGKRRSLPMHDPLHELVERRWQARQFTDASGETGLSPLVFHVEGRPVASTSLWKAWTAACLAAEMPGLLFHDLRRSGVRDMIRAGVPQSVAMRVSGHSTAAVFTRYDISSQEDKLDALERRDAYSRQRSEQSNVTRFSPEKGRTTGSNS